MNANTTRTFPLLSSSCNLPSNVSIYALNITVVPQAPINFLSVYPTGQSGTGASTLNSPLGTVIANATVVGAGQSGSINIFVTGKTDIIIDVNGYFLRNADPTGNNTTLGFNSLTSNTGIDNTALGAYSLQANTTGQTNTATGLSALTVNVSGNANTASGAGALLMNTQGSYNAAFGFQAIDQNTTGSANTALGVLTLSSNTSASYNTAAGYESLFVLAVSGLNTALGSQALSQVTTGLDNLGIGFNAGLNLASGANNVYVGNEGTGNDSAVIRIGTSGQQTNTSLAGISGVTVSGSSLLIDSSDHLGAVQSSRRYKEEIWPIGVDSDALMDLRPVTFEYKQPLPDGTKPVQYGLIAEEVAETYPNLVVRNRNGQEESVQYQQLPALLLQEEQKQHELLQQQEQLGVEQDARISILRKELAALKRLIEEADKSPAANASSR